MRHYEVAVVLHPDLEMDQEGATNKIEAAITALGGKIDKKDNWGKRKLAYTIKKQDWGIYIFYQISLDPSKVQSLENTLRITDEVIRSLIVSLEDIKSIGSPRTPRDAKPETKGDSDKAKAEADASDTEKDA